MRWSWTWAAGPASTASSRPNRWAPMATWWASICRVPQWRHDTGPHEDAGDVAEGAQQRQEGAGGQRVGRLTAGRWKASSQLALRSIRPLRQPKRADLRLRDMNCGHE